MLYFVKDDIAKKLEVSPSTVSRALNNSSHPLKQELRDKILVTAKEMGYVPNAQARFLKTQTNQTIGVIIPSIDNPFYPSMMRGMEDFAMRNNYFIHMFSCDREVSRTDHYMQNMLEQNVRGIVAMYLDYMPPTLMNYAKRGGHVVAVTTTKQNFEGAHNILIDKVLEAYTATKHLVDLGHKKIALFMNEINCEIRRDKVEGYQKAMQEAGLEKDDQYIYVFEPEIPQCREKHNYSTESDVGCDLAKQMLAKSPEVTAIVCMNDLIALGAMAAIRAAGKRVPDDYSVCGFDDAFFAAFLDPPLTTMAVKKYQWGEALVAYLLELIESHDDEKIESVLGTEVVQSAYLIKRGSTSKPRLEYK